MKLGWNDIWMRLAHDIASRSNDPRLKVGCVIVTSDNETVLSLGYNGDEIGGNNKPDSVEPGKSGFIHAETNCIAKMNYSDQRSRKLYLTHSPCSVCARLIVNAKIEKVIYCNDYRDTKGLDILRDRGIIIEHCMFWE
jgi:dCMP deaminase